MPGTTGGGRGLAVPVASSLWTCPCAEDDGRILRDCNGDDEEEEEVDEDEDDDAAEESNEDDDAEERAETFIAETLREK